MLVEAERECSIIQTGVRQVTEFNSENAPDRLGGQLNKELRELRAEIQLTDQAGILGKAEQSIQTIQTRAYKGMGTRSSYLLPSPPRQKASWL